jgi:hypothetical protein
MSDKIIEKDDMVIVITEGFEKSRFDCPTCRLVLRGLEDIQALQTYGACRDCVEFFYWPNIEKWKNGWRPKKEDVHKRLDNYYKVKGK